MLITYIIIGSPLQPYNLRSAQIPHPNSTDVTVTLNWDPPLITGGVAITNYLISVDMSQQVFTTNNTATILQNHTEQTLVEVNTVNDCGLMSDSAMTIINITG
jgi:hypothetical protein